MPRSRRLARERYAHDRIRVAYLSADFHDHATAYLMAGDVRAARLGALRMHAISFGPDDGSEMRQRLAQGLDRFIDCRHQRDDVAQQLRDQEIDIAVDLEWAHWSGPTRDPESRPAPIQVNSTSAIPGTMGLPFHDYIVADERRSPPESARLLTPKQWSIFRDSYQANDGKRPDWR